VAPDQAPFFSWTFLFSFLIPFLSFIFPAPLCVAVVSAIAAVAVTIDIRTRAIFRSRRVAGNGNDKVGLAHLW
jgi:hypothetical protein